MDQNNIRLEQLSVGFFTRRDTVTAVHDVSLTLRGNHITGVIGETGCGKSVMGMAMLQLLPRNISTQGAVFYRGENILTFRGPRLRRLRARQIAFIPQHPDASLNPIMKIKHQISEAMHSTRSGKRTQPNEIISRLFGGLHSVDSDHIGKAYPFQLSGGMQQRILAAIAVSRDPQWILADEPTKGLDSDSKETVRNLLARVHTQTKAGMMVISHDLPFARQLCHYIVVMYCGEVVETAQADDFFRQPAHPYARALLNALPEGGFQPIDGESPSMGNPPGGCRFHPRCPSKKEICTRVAPALFAIGAHHEARCHLYA